jgi:TM2 domain-containing membrane protein YozV/rRNA maturation protein Nop10
MDTKCPRCGEELEADESEFGTEVKCPACYHKFKLSFPRRDSVVIGKELCAAQTPSIFEATPAPRMRTCPFCSEGILASAVKCKHCGEFLVSSMQRTSAGPATSTALFLRPMKSRSTYVLLALFLGGLLGVHNFYAGRFGVATTQLLIMIFLGWTGVGIIINFIWVFVELFAVTTDGKGCPMN